MYDGTGNNPSQIEPLSFEPNTVTRNTGPSPREVGSVIAGGLASARRIRSSCAASPPSAGGGPCASMSGRNMAGAMPIQTPEPFQRPALEAPSRLALCGPGGRDHVLHLAHERRDVIRNAALDRPLDAPAVHG